MNQFFDIEGKFFRRLDKLADIMILNILFVITSIPIITIGPSLAAMYYVLFKIREDKEGNIVKTYFREFRSNLKIGTICWLIMLILAVLLYWDLIIIKAYTGTIERVLRVIVYLLIA